MPTDSKHHLLPLLLLIFIDSFSYFVVIPLLLQLFYGHHADLLPQSTTLTTRNILTGVTIALSPLATLIAAPLIGNASDKYGRKKTLLACLICVTVGFLFPIIGIHFKNVGLILLGRFIAGFGSASQPVAQAAVADVCHQKDKALFLSLIALMMTLALIIGPLAGGYLSDSHFVSWFTMTTPYVFALILSVLNLCLLLFFFRETLHHNVEKIKIPMLSIRDVWTTLPHYIKRYHFGFLMLIFFFLELGWSQYYQSISLFHALKLGYSTQKISVFNAYLGIVMSVGLLILYPLALRVLSVKSLMQYSVLFVLGGLVGCALFATIPIHWFFAGIVALFTGIAYVSLVALISNQTAEAHQGLVMGYLSTILFLAWMMTAFDAGWLISYHAKLPLYLAALFLVFACGGIIYQKGMQHERVV